MPGLSGSLRRPKRRTRRNIAILVLLLLLIAVLSYLSYYYTQNKSLPKLTAADVSAANVIDPPQFLYAIAGGGQAALGRPIGVVIRNGRVYVSDATRSRVSVFTKDGKTLFTFFAINDGKEKKLKTPIHMAFNAKGELFVADRALDALYVFDENGKYLRKFLPVGAPKDFKWSPLAVTFGPDGKLYVSDVRETKGHRMLVYDTTGTQLLAWGKSAQVEHSNEQPGDFYFPNGIAVGKDGTIYVVDGDNRRVQIFDKDGKVKSIIETVGIPRGIWLDEGTQRLIISDALANQVDIYTTKGEKLVSFGEGGAGPGQFKLPNDVALDDEGRIYVADRENHQVQVWGWPKAEVPPVVAAVAQRWYWCLTPLLLLPLLPLFRRREIALTPDFVDGLIATEDLGLMQHKRIRWTSSEDDHAQWFAGRVENGIDLGELIQPVEHSDSDAREIAEKLLCDAKSALVLAIAQRVGRFATEDTELRRLALLLEIDVFNGEEFRASARPDKR